MSNSPGNGKAVSLEDKLDLLLNVVEALTETVEELKQTVEEVNERVQNLNLIDLDFEREYDS